MKTPEAKEQQRRLLMETTMKIIAAKGLVGFSMIQVTESMGVSEAVLYKNFESKEKLLSACFQYVNTGIADHFSKFPIPCLTDGAQLEPVLKPLWMEFFSFLLENKNSTLFYFEYMNSPLFSPTYYKNESICPYLDSLMEEIFHCLPSFGELECCISKITILDISCLYASKIITGVLPDSEECKNEIWAALFHGLLSLTKKNPSV